MSDDPDNETILLEVTVEVHLVQHCKVLVEAPAEGPADDYDFEHAGEEMAMAALELDAVIPPGVSIVERKIIAVGDMTCVGTRHLH